MKKNVLRLMALLMCAVLVFVCCAALAEDGEDDFGGFSGDSDYGYDSGSSFGDDDYDVDVDGYDLPDEDDPGDAEEGEAYYFNSDGPATARGIAPWVIILIAVVVIAGGIFAFVNRFAIMETIRNLLNRS